MDATDTSRQSRATALIRRLAAGACASVAVAAIVLFVAGAWGVVYLAVEAETSSMQQVLHHASRLVCVLLQTCSV